MDRPSAARLVIWPLRCCIGSSRTRCELTCTFRSCVRVSTPLHSSPPLRSSGAPEGFGQAGEPDGLLLHQRGEHHRQLPVAGVPGGRPPADHGFPGHLGGDDHREPAEQPPQQHHLPVADSATGTPASPSSPSAATFISPSKASCLLICYI